MENFLRTAIFDVKHRQRALVRWALVAAIVGNVSGCAPVRGVLAALPPGTSPAAVATPSPPAPPMSTPSDAPKEGATAAVTEAVTAEPSDAVIDALPSPPADTALRDGLAWDEAQALPVVVRRKEALWQPVYWRQVPGWGSDDLESFWAAWVRSCERPARALASQCDAIRRLSIGDSAQRYEWIMRTWQPYRVTALDGQRRGLLTGYFEPMMRASRIKTATHQTPMYAPPSGLTSGSPWFTREEMETDPRALAALQGRELVWMANPIDALIIQIQGSGRLEITEPDGRVQVARLAFAAHNGHTYQSVARGLLDSGDITEPSWPAIKAWAAQKPDAVQGVLWRNPRTVFFQEEDLSEIDAAAGPRGAQGVPLTPMRSIAVDRRSIPYGTPVWMTTAGPTMRGARLVMAQDTGGAIVGAVRADFFAGWGDEAARLAGGLKQPLHLWVLWPRS